MKRRRLIAAFTELDRETIWYYFIEELKAAASKAGKTTGLFER